jgi:hypothetical protein
MGEHSERESSSVSERGVFELQAHTHTPAMMKEAYPRLLKTNI